MRIKINPRNRYDLSHLTAEEANQTLKHIMEDLCFWGNLPLPLLPSNHRTTNGHNPYFYHSHYNEGLIRQQSSGSDGKSHNKKKKKDSSSSHRTSQQQRPPRGQARVWKTAVDPSTGQTYYYDPVSRQTQWEKVRASLLA